MLKNIRPHNKFEFFKTDASGKGTLVGKAENVVLDTFYKSGILHNYHNNYSVSTLHLGSGIGTPVSTRTSLFNQAGTWGVSTYETEWAYPISKRTYYATIGTSSGNNIAFTEVGLGGSVGLYTHAMITDSEGNQITITKTDTEILTIYATIYFEFPDLLSQSNGKVDWVKNPNNLVGQSGLTGAPLRYNSRFIEADTYVDLAAYMRLGGPHTSIVQSSSETGKNVASTYSAVCSGRLDVGVTRAIRKAVYFESIEVSFDEPSTVLGVSVGVGDGSTSHFTLKDREVSASTVYVNNAIVPNSEYYISRKVARVLGAREYTSKIGRSSSSNVTYDGSTPNYIIPYKEGVLFVWNNANTARVVNRKFNEDEYGATDTDVTVNIKGAYFSQAYFLDTRHIVLSNGSIVAFDSDTTSFGNLFTAGNELATYLGGQTIGDAMVSAAGNEVVYSKVGDGLFSVVLSKSSLLPQAKALLSIDFDNGIIGETFRPINVNGYPQGTTDNLLITATGISSSSSGYTVYVYPLNKAALTVGATTQTLSSVGAITALDKDGKFLFLATTNNRAYYQAAPADTSLSYVSQPNSLQANSYYLSGDHLFRRKGMYTGVVLKEILDGVYIGTNVDSKHFPGTNAYSSYYSAFTAVASAYGNFNTLDFNCVFSYQDVANSALNPLHTYIACPDENGIATVFHSFFTSSSYGVAYFNWEYHNDRRFVFKNAPANGAVITADLVTVGLSKHSDNVYDYNFSLKFKE